MADEPINLVLSSQVASRFVSSSDLETARQKREEEWKATYQRLGQEAPPMPNEEYDGRSLYEKLKETKDKKQEAFEEKLKFKNQFRALDDEEVAFLDDAAEEKRAIEMAKQEEIQKEMKRFKEAIASRTAETPVIGSVGTTTAAEIIDKGSAPTSVSISHTVATGSTNQKTTTMIPKKSRKAKDFQRAFLAGAIRPKSTTDQQGASATKKRKSLDTSTPAPAASNQPIASSRPSNSPDLANPETSQPTQDNPPDPKKAKK
ncbi:hypothetical protein PGT21_013623 [Puccinia graminis f. sp. tritici]|uniref:FAM192A/Fyv6 N-terminal domain-containing protein n=2 Tax=Puccinia graminis f. sp. tritici TaxID=56615 RepID=A0A5B0LMS4_PUCGR|nr:hypothetical protein PGTUg99_009424 [Puccinia graminis f. sp. tritici]KAA1090782.1 hypothetical protein PGT21_013623 [Puccinia graminis f. sp. tritici]